MAVPKERVEHHLQCRKEAEALYKANLDPAFESSAWYEAVDEAAAEIAKTTSAVGRRGGIREVLMESGSHTYVLRHLLAPPLSQDQFKLACPSWPKTSEKSGRGLRADVASEVATAIEEWLDPRRAEVLKGAEPGDSTALTMALGRYRTVRRMKLAAAQEGAVVDLLKGLGYQEVTAAVVDQPGVLGDREFMKATQFQTADGSTHEVDVAIGLPRRRILALECKVSNDATNSVKRVNDVLKKATAWKRQWGRLVSTGALLQGVFSKKEPRRLLEEDVEVFWSHRLDEIESWIRRQA